MINMKRCKEKEKKEIYASLEVLRQANEAEKDITMTDVHCHKFHNILLSKRV